MQLASPASIWAPLTKPVFNDYFSSKHDWIDTEAKFSGQEITCPAKCSAFLLVSTNAETNTCAHKHHSQGWFIQCSLGIQITHAICKFWLMKWHSWETWSLRLQFQSRYVCFCSLGPRWPRKGTGITPARCGVKQKGCNRLKISMQGFPRSTKSWKRTTRSWMWTMTSSKRTFSNWLNSMTPWRRTTRNFRRSMWSWRQAWRRWRLQWASCKQHWCCQEPWWRTAGFHGGLANKVKPYKLSCCGLIDEQTYCRSNAPKELLSTLRRTESVCAWTKPKWN